MMRAMAEGSADSWRIGCRCFTRTSLPLGSWDWLLLFLFLAVGAQLTFLPYL